MSGAAKRGQKRVAENVIELNGKRYDAKTGAYLGAGRKPDVGHAHPAKKGRVIDGFIRQTAGGAPRATHAKPAEPKKAAAKAAPVPTAVPKAAKTLDVKRAPKPKKPEAPTAAAAPAPTPQPAEAKPATHHATPSPASSKPKPAAPRKSPVAHAHKPERAKTLMRRTVHKPNAHLKPAIKPQLPAEAGLEPVTASALFKPSGLEIDKARLERAKAVKKYRGIRRFFPFKSEYTPPAELVTPATQTNVPVIAVQPTPAHAHPKSNHKGSSHGDIFEAAIARAESHKEPKHEPKRRGRRRAANALAGVAAFLVIGGFVTYMNLPNIQLHVASIQAGFKADMPSYQPSGYALQGGPDRTGNTVTLTFAAGENHFSLTQQPSNWNSQTLLENTLALTTGDYKTVKAAGRTVYIYDGNSATWVDSGVRYDITGNAPLSAKDITSLASSL